MSEIQQSSSDILRSAVDGFLTYNPVRVKEIRSDHPITRAHAPVSGERKSGIPAEVLMPDDR
jgi:hypothetical protein